jgi:hypothetical protein
MSVRRRACAALRVCISRSNARMSLQTSRSAANDGHLDKGYLNWRRSMLLWKKVKFVSQRHRVVQSYQ